MSTTTIEQTITSRGVEARVLNESYGPGAWHGPDLKAALADVTPDLAFWRPADGRHNIAEVALHHAFCARAVRGQLSGIPPEPFVLDGEDWFALPDESVLPWSKILATVEAEQQRLAALVADIGPGQSAITDAERFNLVLGITCHAIYHAGQVQLIKRLHVP
jgi:hypothetical protein